MFTLFNDSGIVVDGAPVTAASLTYPTLTGPVTVALVLASVVGGTRLTLPPGSVLTPGLGELMFTTAVDTYKGNVNIGASCTGKPAEHIAGPPYPGFPPAASGVDPVPPVTNETTLAVHTVDMETYPDGSVHGIRSDGTTFLIQAAPVAPPAVAKPCPSVRVSTGGFLFHATDVTDPLATLLIEDCDGIALGYGYPTAGLGHTAELWSCAQPSVLLGYAANQSDCAPPCPCPGTSSTSGANGVDGADGAPGAPGAPGQSAYQIAVTNGFVGTEAQWLASLQGADGTFDGSAITSGAPLCVGTEEVLVLGPGPAFTPQKRALRQNTHATVVAAPLPLTLTAAQVNAAFDDALCKPVSATHVASQLGWDSGSGLVFNYVVNNRATPRPWQQTVTVAPGDVLQITVQALKFAWDTNPPLFAIPNGVFKDNEMKLAGYVDHYPRLTGQSGVGTGGNNRVGVYYAVALTAWTGVIDVSIPWYTWTEYFNSGDTTTWFATGGNVEIARLVGIDTDNPIAKFNATAVRYTGHVASGNTVPTYVYNFAPRESACNPVMAVASTRYSGPTDAFDVAVADQILFEEAGAPGNQDRGSLLVTFNPTATALSVHGDANGFGTSLPADTTRDGLIAIEYRADRDGDANTLFSAVGANITITNTNSCGLGALDQPGVVKYTVESGHLEAWIEGMTSYEALLTVQGVTKYVTFTNPFQDKRKVSVLLPTFSGTFPGVLAPGATSAPLSYEIVVASAAHLPVTTGWVLNPGRVTLEVDHAA